ncbi:hypothetical protein D046_7484B, partial [Vibrio parahaemolyticus V-223/04]
HRLVSTLQKRCSVWIWSAEVFYCSLSKSMY